MRNRTLWKGLERWSDQARTLARQREIILKSLGRAKHRSVFAAFSSWGYSVWTFKDEHSNAYKRQHLLDLVLGRGDKRRGLALCAVWFTVKEAQDHRLVETLVVRLEETFEVRVREGGKERERARGRGRGRG